MPPRQTILPLLIAGLIVASAERRTGGVCSSAAGCLTPPQVTTAAAMPVATSGTFSTTQSAVGAESHARADAKATRELSGAGAAQLAEQVAVRHVLREVDLDLTSEQCMALAAVTGHYQTVRQAFEATIATVVGRENLRVEIPAYPAAGDALREKFYGELRERLGEGAAAQITQRAGAALEGYFGGFGVSVQTLDFSPSAATAQADYQVTRTARYWNSAEAREALTLRRETHFPGMEDPTGERWAPFLALLANRGAE